MSRRAWGWLALVFCLTLAIELPVSWLVGLLGLPAEGVVGSLWHGQAARLGVVGPVQWQWRPWQQHLQVRIGFQGQGWQARLKGWPWRWQAGVQALGPQYSVGQGYRLAGQWQGAVSFSGAGQQCRAAEGSITVADLALSDPFALGLGHGELHLDCRQGWRLMGQLAQQGQHQLNLDADLLQRRAQVAYVLQADAALTPVLRGLQWLGPEQTAGQRRVSW